MHKPLPPASPDAAATVAVIAAQASPADTGLPPFLQAPGAMGALIAAFDWSRTALGPLADWPTSLTTPLTLILGSPVPMQLLCGTEGVFLYNDSYAALAGARHPRILGRPTSEAWPEAWVFNEYVMAQCLAGNTLSFKDQEFVVQLTGEPEQVWLNLDYSPVLGAAGTPVAVLGILVNSTAKVRAERRVSRERERLHLMFAQAPSFMAMLSGPDHVVDLVNPAFMQMVGPREVLGKSAREAFPDAAGQGFCEMLDKVYASGRAFFGRAIPGLVKRMPGAAPEQRYVDAVLQPLRGDDDQVMGVFVEGSDVTARVQAEAAVRASELQLREFAQTMPNQVWAAQPDGQLDWFNDRVLRYSGLTPDELRGTGWVVMVHEDDLAGAQTHWARALLSGQPCEIEFRLRRADGKYFWHLSRAQAIRDGARRITRWVGTNTDIDEQKRTALALTQLNNNLEQQVAARTADRNRMWRLSPDLMSVADMQGVFVAVNPAWTALLGWTQEELVGHSTFNIVHPDDIPAMQEELGGQGQGLPTLRFELRVRHRDGSYRVVVWMATPEAGLVHAVGRDVTAEREAALALKNTEAALQQVQRMESIGQLTGGVAHDFNNLLQVISGNLQLLERAVTGQERSQAYVQRATAGVNRAAKLASQLLSFSSRQPLDPESVNLGSFVSGLEELLRRTLGEGIAVQTVVAEGLWNSLVDPARVEDALLNLALNARDAMDGNGRLTLAAGNALLDEAYVAQEPGVVAGPLRAAERERHRLRHDARGAAEGIRAVFLDQAQGQRHGPGAVDGVWLRQAVGRAHQGG